MFDSVDKIVKVVVFKIIEVKEGIRFFIFKNIIFRIIYIMILVGMYVL